jgi:excisionase family DNA binding protein
MASNEQPLADVSFLTVAEVATKMRVSKMTVYRLVHNGELPAVRVGRSFRVPENAVQAYLRSSFYEADIGLADSPSPDADPTHRVGSAFVRHG